MFHRLSVPLVPTHRHLADRAAGSQQRGLALDLVRQRQLDRAERVQVLDLDLGTGHFAAREPQRDVGFAAHGPLVHVAARHVQVAQEHLQFVQVSPRLLRRADVGLGDDLDQGQARAIEIQEAVVSGVGKPGRVLLQVHPPDADTLHATARAVGIVDLDPTIAAEGQLVHGDLVSLGQVGVKVVLAGKGRCLCNMAVEGQPDQDRLLHRPAVGDRQRPWKPQANRTDVGVGLSAENAGVAATEHLGPGQKLGMDLHADDGFVVSHLFPHDCTSGDIIACFPLARKLQAVRCAEKFDLSPPFEYTILDGA